jgi:tRNA1(Val) A37 N6-methylase TrmN6
VTSPDAPTRDAFLGGRVHVLQPARGGGHRSGLDAVYLAAAVPHDVEGHVVDLGSGAGAAGFCLAARLGQVRVTLVDRDTNALALARDSLKLAENHAFADRIDVLQADITAKGKDRHAAGLVPALADHVIMNPPYYLDGHVRVSPALGRAGAHVLDERGLEPWARTATDILRDGGSLTLVFRADGLDQILTALHSRFGAIDVIPLYPRAGAPATRVLVRALRASRAPLRLLPGFVVHEGAGSPFTDHASAVMRDGAGLVIPRR